MAKSSWIKWGSVFYILYFSTGLSRSKSPCVRSSTCVGLTDECPNVVAINRKGRMRDKCSTLPVLLLMGDFCSLVSLPASICSFSSCCSKMTHRCRSSWRLFSAAKILLLLSSTLTGKKKKKKRVVQLIYVMTIKDQLVLVLNPASCCTAPNRGKKRIFHASKGRNPNEIVPDDILQICRTELTNEYSWK